LRLFHFSEDPAIVRFEPRLLPTSNGEAVVWAIDEERAPLYLLPRDCPRVCFYAKPDSLREDVERFLGHTTARLVIAVESGWLDRIRSAQLFRYLLPANDFALVDSGAGYYVAHRAIEPLAVEPVGDLLEALTAANVEVRITPSLWPLHDAVAASSLHFSMIRMRNALPR
jgi:hypothetical protein